MVWVTSARKPRQRTRQLSAYERDIWATWNIASVKAVTSCTRSSERVPQR